MKKVISLIVMSFLVLLLSGCDLVSPEIIDRATEELCRENPDNELCQSDGLADLEESVVLNLFNDMLVNYDDVDNTDFCDEYISITNVELLDSCRNDKSSLFPEDIEDYEAKSVTIEGDFYIVNLESKVDAEKLKFILKTKVDGTSILIDEWSFGDSYIIDEGINQDDVLSLLVLFVADLEDETVTDEAVCTTWYDGIDDDCDGIEDARRKFKAGADLAKTINILDPDSDDDTLIGEVSFTIDGHVTVLKISFDVEIVDGVLSLVIVDEDTDDDGFSDFVEGIEKDEIKRGLEAFITDFVNPDITDEQICAIWYEGIDNDCDDIGEDRLKFKAGAALSKAINVLDDDDDGDGLIVAEVSYINNGHVTVLKIVLDVSTELEELKIVVIESDVFGDFDFYLTALESLELFNGFVVDYLNPLVTFEELNIMYFNGEMDKEFENQRLTDIEDGLIVNVLTTIDPLMNEEGYFIIEVEFIIDGVSTYEEVNIKPIRLDLAIIINFSDGGNYEDEVFNITEVEELWLDFVEDYLDILVTFEDLNMMYFNGMLDAEFNEMRVFDLESGALITTISIKYSNPFPDSFFDIVIEITTDGMVTTEEIKIRVNRIDMALYLSFKNIGNADMIPYDEALTSINSYVAMYNDYSIDSHTVCSSYIVDFQVDQCILERDSMITSNMIMSSFELYTMDDQYMVDFIFEDGDSNLVTVSKMVYLLMNEDGTYLIELYEFVS